MTNTPTQAAIEAAARAISHDGFGADWPHALRTATAAIAAYRAAMREAGVVEVNLAELERAGVVLTAREEG